MVGPTKSLKQRKPSAKSSSLENSKYEIQKIDKNK